MWVGRNIGQIMIMKEILFLLVQIKEMKKKKNKSEKKKEF